MLKLWSLHLVLGSQVPDRVIQLAAGHVLQVVTYLMKPSWHLPFERIVGGKQKYALPLCVCSSMAIVLFSLADWINPPRLPNNLEYQVSFTEALWSN